MYIICFLLFLVQGAYRLTKLEGFFNAIRQKGASKRKKRALEELGDILLQSTNVQIIRNTLSAFGSRG